MNDLEFRTCFAGTPLLGYYEACTDAEQEELRRILDRIHGCFDLWYIGGARPQLRFGFRELDSQNGRVIGRLDVGARPPLLRLYYGANGRNGGWAPREGQGLPIATADDLPADCDGFLRQRAEQAQAIGVDNLGPPAVPARAGRYWPSDYRANPPPPLLLSRPELNTILYGPPGTGKTFATTGLAISITGDAAAGISEYASALLDGRPANPPSANDWRQWTDAYREMQRVGRIVFTTFHQNYAYEDFVEGIRARVSASGVEYYNHDGILKEIAYRALFEWLKRRDPEGPEELQQVVLGWLESGTDPGVEHEPNEARNYVLIIDEINRGNIARILGELITLLEPSKRATRDPGLGDQPLKVKLPYTGKPFILPPNLYIIGTMNTADRSLIGLDVALRRRFSFVELRPSPALLNPNLDGVDLQTLLKTINERIAAELDDEHLLGHAYFMGVDSVTKLAAVMRDRVIPQLREYFHDRPEALLRILARAGADDSPLLEINDGRVLVRRPALALAASYTAIYA